MNLKANIVMFLFTISAYSLLAEDIAPIVPLSFVQNEMSQKNDTTYIINFWATWCKPCIEELPLFEELTLKSDSSKLKVLLVSLDFIQDREKILIPFLRKKQIHSNVVLLDAGNPNVWIDTIDPEWSGSLPATVIVNNAKQHKSFHEKQFEKEDLYSLIQSIMEK